MKPLGICHSPAAAIVAIRRRSRRRSSASAGVRVRRRRPEARWRQGDANVCSDEPAGLSTPRDGNGDTALIIAIDRSDEQCTGFLLDKGADRTCRQGWRHAADRRPAQWLRSSRRMAAGSGAKVDATNQMGETPLIIAVQQRQTPHRQALLEAGADPDKADTAAGYSARDYAKRDNRGRATSCKLIDAKKPKASRPPLTSARPATDRSAPRAGAPRGARNAAIPPCVVQAPTADARRRGRWRRRSGRRRSARLRSAGSAPPRGSRARCGGTAQKKRSQYSR